MPKVTLLSPDVIAKIAAGEVVDRPSSVVKELVENSIDAQATSIEVHLKDAGKELIRVKDNGSGITKGDLGNIFQRHATSKINNIDDLETLISMGFRGEALFSIAAVSDVTVESQSQGSKESWLLHLRAGKRLLLEPCAAKGHGTEIKVSELFFNTPARRKFLKSSTSELNQCVHTLLNYGLLYPDKRFLLTHAGKTLLDLRPAPNLQDRMAAALNLNTADLLETSQDFPEDKIYIKAVLSNINIARPRRDMQYFFINRRPVEHKSLGFTLNDVYRAILPPGVYPAFLISIQLDPSCVDANIHPAKKEVRILTESRVVSLVRHLVDYTLMRFGGTKKLEAAPGAPSAVLENISFEQGLPAGQIIYGPGQKQPDFSFSASLSPRPAMPAAAPDLFAAPAASMTEKFSRARYIGSLNNKFLLFEDGSSLLCVDQHAAQERIMFERFTRQIEDGAIEVQPLLTPILIKLSIVEAISIEEYGKKLGEVGIETALLDEGTLAIHAHPVLLKNIESAVRLLLSGNDINRCDRNTIARRACKASITAGDRLSPLQAEHQRRELLQCNDPFTCPHGRPIIIELSDSFLDRQFLRT